MRADRLARVIDRVTGALLWTAALGGFAFLALNFVVGVGSGVLWVTVPVAALALVMARRRARAARPPRR